MAKIHPNNPVLRNPKFAKLVFDQARQPMSATGSIDNSPGGIFLHCMISRLRGARPLQGDISSAANRCLIR